MRSFLLNLLTFYKIDMTLLAKGHGMCFKLSEKKHFKRTQSVLKYILSIFKTISVYLQLIVNVDFCRINVKPKLINNYFYIIL